MFVKLVRNVVVFVYVYQSMCVPFVNGCACIFKIEAEKTLYSLSASLSLYLKVNFARNFSYFLNYFVEKDTFEEIQIYRLLLKVFEPDRILVQSVNAENHDEMSVKK